MPETYDSKYFSGQGPLHVAQRDPVTGKPLGLVFVGDVTGIGMTPNVEKNEIIENTTGSRGVAASSIKRAEYALSIAFRSVKPAHLAQALHAVLTDKTGSSVTDEAVNGYHDKLLRLDHVKVSAVSVTHTTGTPTYVAGTDYNVVDAETGLIEILSGGAITDGQEVHVDYSYAAQSHFKIDPNNDELYLVWAGINTADNDKAFRCEIYKAKLDPASLNLITDDITDMTVQGTVLLDSLRTAGDEFYSYQIEN